ncbi:DUF4167 domain-containing protein [Sphingomonas sp. RB3P16]|uniref:DUF4167 domain-containing protein n=1 Tax=Parasphingomonas frigoris TaxID=3096163 RepID=UPI002FC9FCE1
MINNRQAGRRRGRGGQQQRSSGGGGNPGRQDTGNRIDNRARGNAAQLLEKYKTLARDAQMQGDRVNVEYYLQFADHYFRVLAETRARFEENGGAVSTKRIQGATLDEDEPDYEDEGERVIEQPRFDQQRGDQQRGDQQRGDQQRGDQQRGDQQRGDQPRGDQQRGGQNGYRQDSNRQDGNRSYAQNGQHNGTAPHAGQQNGESRADGQAYDDRPRNRANGNGNGNEGGGYERNADAPREDRSERQPRAERQDRSARAPAPIVEQADSSDQLPLETSIMAEAPVTAAVEAPVEPPRRGRGRPRREVAPVVESALDEAGLEEDRFAADRLPPMLRVSAVVAPEVDGDGELIEKPRRRRGRPPASASSTAE